MLGGMVSWGWQHKAACTPGTARLFFRKPKTKGARQAAEQIPKRICWGCPVRLDCLDASIRQRESDGVWGGLSALERKHVLADAPDRPLNPGEGLALVRACPLREIAAWAS